MRTEPRETSPSLRWGVARLDGDKTHRMQALLYGSRMTQVSTKMAPMMAAMMEKAVPQAVLLSMCHPICIVRGFGTGLLGDSLPLTSV